MASVPFYCEVCNTRRGPSEPTSALGDKAVGLCCAPKKSTVKITKTPTQNLEFGDLMEYFKFKIVPVPKGKSDCHSWWRKEINEDMCIYVTEYGIVYSTTGPMSKALALDGQAAWPWEHSLAEYSIVRDYLSRHLGGMI